MDIIFDASVTELLINGKPVWTAHVQTYGGVYMRFDIVSGAYKGKSFQVMYQKTNLNLLSAITMAFSDPDGPMPGSFDEAMVAPLNAYLMYSCADAACQFIPPPTAF